MNRHSKQPKTRQRSTRAATIAHNDLGEAALAARRWPDNTEVWSELIANLADTGLSKESIHIVTQLLGSFPDDLDALMSASQYLHMIGRPNEACALIDRALAVSPSSLSARRQHARILENIDAEQALRAWESVLNSLPTDPEAAFQSGKLALALGDEKLGETRLREAIAAPSALAGSVMVLFRHLLWSGRHSEARQLCKQAIRRWPRKPEAWVPIFELLRLSSSTNTADRLLRRVTLATAGRAEDQLFLAGVMEAIGRVDSARSHLRNLASDSAIGAEAASQLIRNLLRAGDLAGAEQIARTQPNWIRTSLGNKASSDLAIARAFAARFNRNPTGSRTLQGVFLDEFARARRNPPGRIVPRPGVVLHLVHSLALGGTERQCATVAAAQARRDSPAQEVWVLRTDPGEHGRATFFLKELTSAGVKSTTLARFRLSAPHDTRTPPLLAACSGILADVFGAGEISALLAAIRDISPSVVQAWTPQTCAYGVIAAHLAGVPKVVLRAGSVAPGDRKFRTEIETQHFSWLRDAIRSAMDTPNVSLFSNCQTNLDSWLKWLDCDHGDLADKIGVLPNILDPSSNAKTVCEADRQHIRRRFHLNKDAFLIGAVARFEREKGIDLWYEIVDRVCTKRDDVVFILVGEGRLKSEIERWMSRRGLGPRVRLIDSMGDELPALISSFDLAILTSYFEGVPNSLLEAQWHGVPVLAPDVGGVREAMIPDRSGLLIERNGEAFAAAIEKLIDDVPLRTRMQAAARRFARENFSPKRALEVLDRAYATLPAQRSRRFVIQPAKAMAGHSGPPAPPT